MYIPSPQNKTFSEWTKVLSLSVTALDTTPAAEKTNWEEWARDFIEKNSLLDIPFPHHLRYASPYTSEEELWKTWVKIFINTMSGKN